MHEDFAGNSLGTAKALDLTSSLQTFSGSLNPLNTNDYYSLALSNRSNFNLSLSGLSANAEIELLNSRGEVLQTSAQPGTSSESLFTTLNAGSYYIKVYSDAATTTDYNLSLSATPSQNSTSLQNRDSLTGFENPSFDTGVFTVGSSGQVSIDYLFDGGSYQGELAIFRLAGMEQFTDLNEFIAEATRRALSDSHFGHVVISDLSQGARFHGSFAWERDFNSGEYLGINTFSMRPGDAFAVMLVPNGTVQQVFNNPGVKGAVRPLFSLSTRNPNDAFHVEQIADVTGDGNTFAMEDLRVDGFSDKDYNDMIFQVRGAAGEAVQLNEVINPARDWRNTDLGQALINYATPYVNLPTSSDSEVLPTVDSEGVVPPLTEVDGVWTPVEEVTPGNSLPVTSQPLVTLPVDSDFDPMVTQPGGLEGVVPPLTEVDGVWTPVEEVTPGNSLPVTSQPLVTLPVDSDFDPMVTQPGGSEPIQFDFPVANQPLIGVIDTGFSGNNPDIDYSRIILGSDRISNDNNPLLQPGEGSEHGTHVLGIIAATQNNEVGIDGVNDKAPIWVGRAVGSGQWAESLVDFVNAARESNQKNAVVNLSLDLTQVNPDGSVTTRYEFTPAERSALEYARQSNVLVVVAAGNDGGVMSALGQASQEFDNIITVGAADGVNRAAYSSYGYGLDILAPGRTEENPMLSMVGDGVGTMAGTSVASARVTGAVSQVWAANPALSYRQVIEIIKNTATDLDKPNWDEFTGAGLLNLAAAVLLAKVTTPLEYEAPATVVPETWSGEGKVTASDRAAAVPMWPTVESISFPGRVMATIGANVRSGPGTSYPIVGSRSYNRLVNFNGWTYGERITDIALGTPDERWYRIAGTNNQWIASAIIDGNAPNSTPLPPGNSGGGGTPLPQPGPQVPINSNSANYRNGRVNPFAYRWQGQCTWYTYGRMLETGLLPAGAKANNWFLGDAWTWRRDAQRAGLPITTTPTPGARGIVVWPPNTKGTLQWGHVAFLEEVYPDGRIRISESNWAGKGISERILTPAQYSGLSFVRLENATPNPRYSSPPAQPGKQREYRVRSGDTLSGIAYRELGNANRWREITKADGSTFTDAEARLLQVGMSVYLPVSYQTGPGTPVTSPPRTNPTPIFDPNGTLITAGNWGTFSDRTATTSSSIGFNGDQNDFIRFSVANNRTNVNLQLSGLSADTDLQLIRDVNNNGRVDPGEVLGQSLNPGTSVDSVSRILDSGDYFIRVYPGVSSAKTNYSLSIRTANLAGQVRSGSENVNLWRYDTGGRTERNNGTYQGIDPSKETVIIIHGWNNNDQSASIRELAKEASEFAPQVLALDWGSIAKAGLDGWFGDVVPDNTAKWIAPVAQWAYDCIKKLGISANNLTLIGHSLGAHVSSQIGRLFNGVKNIVALDPAYPANNYDIDISQSGKQEAANFRDVATKSLAFVVADNNAGAAGDNDKASTAHDSFLMRFDASDRRFITAVGTHGAVIDAFTNALDRRLLTLPDLNLPNHVDNWYDNNGDKDNWLDRRNNPGKHEGTISAVWTGNKLDWSDGRNPWALTGLQRVVNSSGTDQTTWT